MKIQLKILDKFKFRSITLTFPPPWSASLTRDSAETPTAGSTRRGLLARIVLSKCYLLLISFRENTPIKRRAQTVEVDQS